MAILTYVAIASLDGYVEDGQGKFDWAAPDEEVHAFVNDLERPVGTYLYGRRMYETMAYWETDDNRPPVYHDYAEIWRRPTRSSTPGRLQTVSSQRTRIEREFDAAAIQATEGELAVRHHHRRSAELAGQAIAEGLVDECHLLLGPVLVGGGKRALPAGSMPSLELLDERRFRNGVVYLRYRYQT